MHRPCAMSCYAAPWKALAQDLFAAACLLGILGAMTVFAIATVPA